MFKVTTDKAAAILGLPKGYVTYNDEKAAELRAQFRAAVNAEDDARFNEAVKNCPKGAWVVRKTWQDGGVTLRRGTIVRAGRASLGGCIVRTLGTNEPFCTCGWNILKKHAVQCNGETVLYATSYDVDGNIISRVERSVYYGSVVEVAEELLAELDGHGVRGIVVEKDVYGARAHVLSDWGMDWVGTFGIYEKEN